MIQVIELPEDPKKLNPPKSFVVIGVDGMQDAMTAPGIPVLGDVYPDNHLRMVTHKTVIPTLDPHVWTVEVTYS